MNKKALAIALTLSLMMSLAVAAAQGIKPQIHTTKNPTLSEKRMLKDFGSNVQVIQMNNTFSREVVLLDRYHKEVARYIAEESSNIQESSSRIEESSSRPQESSSKVEESSKPQESSKPEESSKPQESSSKPQENSSTAHTHTWQPVTTTIHHNEEGHWETVEVVTTETVEVWVVDKEAWDEQKLVKDAWDEYSSSLHEYCSRCEKDLTGLSEDALWDHLDSHEGGAGWFDKWVTEIIAHHEAEYDTIHHAEQGHTEIQTKEVTKEEQRWVVDKAACDEEVVTGYKCSICGAEK